MTISFDTLGYSKALKAAGVPEPQAEAHAESARDFIMVELVTKSDLRAALDAQAMILTIRMGAMMALAVGALAALISLT